MLAYVHQNTDYTLKEMTTPKAGRLEVIVEIKYAGLNRRDLYIGARRGENPEALTLGSDGAGMIHEIGQDVKGFSVGDEVLINPAINWFEQSIAPPENFDILGMPDNGTFTKYLVISIEQIEKKPTYLNLKEASVVALSGLTGYRALVTKGQVKSGDTVFIPGGSGGVSTFLIQLAKAKGARVIVTSRSSEKRKKARDLGANLVLDTEANWLEELREETIDLVIDSVGGEVFQRALKIVKKGGRVVVFGATTADTIQFNLREFFYGQYELIGSTMGNRDELRALLKFMEINEIKPVIDKVYPLKEAESAFRALEASEQFGKIVLKIN